MPFRHECWRTSSKHVEYDESLIRARSGKGIAVYPGASVVRGSITSVLREVDVTQAE